MTGPEMGSSLSGPCISVVINTLNEENNLPYALRSVRPWVDEIIVVDMYSEDRTVEIAREYGAKVYFHPKVVPVESARSFAIAKASGDWILLLDADEMIPRPLSNKLIEIARYDRADVVGIPRLNYMLGAPMMHTRVHPNEDVNLRFFKPGFLGLTETIHRGSHPVATSRVTSLPYEPGQSIVHFANINLFDILDKVNRYTTIEAEQSPSRGERPSALRAVARASKRFFHHYVKGKGYRDGWQGFYVSAASALYVLLTDGKLFELHKHAGREAVRRLYQGEAEKIIMEYDVTLRSSSHTH